MMTISAECVLTQSVQNYGKVQNCRETVQNYLKNVQFRAINFHQACSIKIFGSSGCLNDSFPQPQPFTFQFIQLITHLLSRGRLAQRESVCLLIHRSEFDSAWGLQQMNISFASVTGKYTRLQFIRKNHFSTVQQKIDQRHLLEESGLYTLSPLRLE